MEVINQQPKKYAKNDPEYFKSYYQKNKDKFKKYTDSQNSTFSLCECGKFVKDKYKTAHALKKCHIDGVKELREHEKRTNDLIAEQIRRETAKRKVNDIIESIYDGVEKKPEIMFFIK